MIRRRLAPLILVTIALAAAAAGAQGPQFRYERPVLGDAPGPNRLAVDGPLVLGTSSQSSVDRHAGTGMVEFRMVPRQAFRDLRLVDASGKEVPYLLVWPDADTPIWSKGTVLPVATTEKTSGFDADLGALQVVDTISVIGLPAPFLKRLVLEGSGDRGHWTTLVAEGTLFDLPAERLKQTRLSFRAGPYRFLRVTWDDTNSGRVPLPTEVYARQAPGKRLEPARVVIEAPFERRPSEPGRSRYRVRLPATGPSFYGFELHVGGGHVFREAFVTEAHLQGAQLTPREIGRGTLSRVVRDGMTAESLSIPLSPPTERTVDLVVEDGNNPPFDLQRITLILPRYPWIYFESPGGPITARYGNDKVPAPRYDLEAVRESIDLATVREATWGEPRAETASSTTAATPAPPMPDAGAPLDPSAYRFRRRLPDGSPGLVALQLDASVLAHSRGAGRMFEDVRVVDDAGLQIPYLVERQEEPLSLDLELKPFVGKAPEVRSSEGRQRSAYAATLPYSSMPGATLVLETSARVFTRGVSVGLERPADRSHRDAWFEAVANRTWTHTDQDVPAPALSIPLVTTRGDQLVVVVDEGDNSTLPLTKARLLLPSYRLRFYHPGRPLSVVYGRDDASLPRYDLALLAPQVMGAEAREIAAAPADDTKPGASTSLVSPKYFWAGLVVAVLVIGAVIVRQLRT